MVQDGHEELNNRIQELASEMRSPGDLDTVKESPDLIVKYSQLQASVTASLEIVLDTVLKQNMTLACNILLARRDSLLKACSSKLGPKDLANLHTDRFDQQEVFNSDILSVWRTSGGQYDKKTLNYKRLWQEVLQRFCQKFSFQEVFTFKSCLGKQQVFS